jgi:hypothetical protein
MAKWRREVVGLRVAGSHKRKQQCGDQELRFHAEPAETNESPSQRGFSVKGCLLRRSGFATYAGRQWLRDAITLSIYHLPLVISHLSLIGAPPLQ